jgi:MoaA/NifB/PqqE/SkfB family radical SAM enzyme
MGRSEKGEPFTGFFPGNEKRGEAKSSFRAKVRKDSSLTLPPEIGRKLGLTPGAKVDIVRQNGRLLVHPNIHSLARVYIEPTSVCNLTCQTCIRNTWTEPLGFMKMGIFDRLAKQLKKFPHLQSVMFGGFGEPTAHPEILPMIRRVKSIGVRAEMVTNGTLLDKKMIQGLFDGRLDRLWISFDGADGGSFEDIRKGASFRQVMGGLEFLQKLNKESPHTIDLGIAFVVMRKNIDDLRNLDRLIWATGARKISVSNVLPYTEEMESQMVCSNALTLETLSDVEGRVDISLPRLDLNGCTKEAFLDLFRGYHNLSLMGNKISTETRQCRFIQDRCTFIRWDGKVSPCMGLLHSHTTFLYGLPRAMESSILGDVSSGCLLEIWNSKKYREFREKVRAFDFSPCHICGGCYYVEKNREDCFGNTFPACGGCLWAQGIIQCP